MAELHETISIEKKTIRKYKPRLLEIPKYISDNLKYNFFEWQKKAFENLLVYEADHKQKPTHLMFNMATGTGKTLLMAATILYYYNQGYRHFIFFVNQNNIVDKTENNFIKNTHNKYLFKDKIIIYDKTVNIKKVETFSDNSQDIEIKFITIQKLYENIHIEKENQTTLDDLQKKDIVMLADEAHHLNANTRNIAVQTEVFETKLKGTKHEKEKIGWEHTVIEYILKKYDYQRGIYLENNKNVLLEFTATPPTDISNVKEKYEDKIIYKFELKDFLFAGYTKEINLISSTLDKKERILQALLFHWYRHKIALKNNIANFKPVILFKSKTISESKTDYKDFLTLTNDIQISDFHFLKEIKSKVNESKNIYEQGKSRTRDVLEFITKEKINIGEIANFIKNNFTEKNLIITNSKTNKTKTEKTTGEQEKLLNNLEDKNNYIRAIFTVNRLTEGWDVLNLFDIVRLYKGRDEGRDKKGNRTTGKTTTSEIQLIGRGIRYFPFKYQDKQKNKRKFDNDLGNELRVLEALYFYCTSEHRYIDELKRALKKAKYLPKSEDKTIKTFALKEEFQNSDFYKNTKIWYNEEEENQDRKKKTLGDIKKDFFIPYNIEGLELIEQEIDIEKQEDLQRLILQEKGLETIFLKFKDIEKHIFLKAINIKAKQEKSLYQFERLKKELDIKSIEDLQTDKLADFDVKVIIQKKKGFQNKTYKKIFEEFIEAKDKLKITIKFLDNVLAELKNAVNPKKGSDFKTGNFNKFFSQPKTKIIEKKNLDDSVAKDNDWYILDGFAGTSQEKTLVKFIKETMGNLENKYQEIYLLRNEEVYKIYDFKKGRGFQPDFILFLKGKNKDNFYYQIFIEPKGDQYLGDDETFETGQQGWKEKFLKEISKRYGLKNIIKAENLNYRLIGLPFFNENKNQPFENEYQKIIASLE